MNIQPIIINTTSGSTLRLTSLKDFFSKLEFAPGKKRQYRIDDILIKEVKDFKHGILLNLRTETETFDKRDEEFLTQVSVEEASLYLYDNGDVFYVHKGEELFDIEEYKYVSNFINVSNITDKLDKKLGKPIDIDDNPKEEKKSNRRKLIEERRKAIVDRIKVSIEKDRYIEKTESLESAAEKGFRLTR